MGNHRSKDNLIDYGDCEIDEYSIVVKNNYNKSEYCIKP